MQGADLRESSIKKQEKFEEEFDDLIRKKYNVDREKFMNMDYRERNEKFYQMLKPYQGVCVVPEVPFDCFSELPSFTIIETSLKDLKREQELAKARQKQEEIIEIKSPLLKKSFRKSTVKSKMIYDIKHIKGNRGLYVHLNQNELLKYKGKIDQSGSVNFKKKQGPPKMISLLDSNDQSPSKAQQVIEFRLHETLSKKKTLFEKMKPEIEEIQKMSLPSGMSQILQNRVKAQARVSVENVQMFNSLFKIKPVQTQPPSPSYQNQRTEEIFDQNSIKNVDRYKAKTLARKTSITKKESNGSQKTPSPNFRSFISNVQVNLDFSNALKFKMNLSNNTPMSQQYSENGIGGGGTFTSNRKLLYKFQEALRKKVRMHVENQQMAETYLLEKRKLELQMLKDSRKNKALQKILKMAEGEPDKVYRYQQFKQRYRKAFSLERHGIFENKDKEINRKLTKQKDEEFLINESFSSTSDGDDKADIKAEQVDHVNQALLDTVFFNKRSLNRRGSVRGESLLNCINKLNIKM